MLHITYLEDGTPIADTGEVLRIVRAPEVGPEAYKCQYIRGGGETRDPYEFPAGNLQLAIANARQIASVKSIPIQAFDSLRSEIENRVIRSRPLSMELPRQTGEIKVERQAWPGPLRDDTDLEAYLYAVVDPLEAVWRLDGRDRREQCLKALNADQIAFFAIWMVDGEIDNGGIVQAVSNSAGEFCEEAVQGFRRFGLDRHADLLDQALSRYERPIPFDREDRNRMLERVLGVRYFAEDLTEPPSPEGTSEMFEAGSALTDDVESEYFALKREQGDFLRVLSRIVELKKGSFFA